MKKLITLTLFVLSLCVGTYGQTFSSGSTGADGAFNPPMQVPAGTPPPEGDCSTSPGCTVTVPLPANGTFNFTTVTIGPFVTVKFRRNAANTPVTLLAQGDVTINGTIDISGQNGAPGLVPAQGGPGGFSGGIGGVWRSDGFPGSGGGSLGPGGVGAGGGGQFVGIPELLPLVGGSGGSGGNLIGTVAGGNGGGGGGALLIASSTVIDLGSGSSTPAILTNGGNGATVSGGQTGGGGSGGALRLIATDIRGSRRLLATAGSGGSFPARPGRIRLESVRLLAYTGQTNPEASINKPGQIGPVRPPVTPTLRIVSIAGMPLPAQPTFDSSTPDLLLPADFTNPVAIELEATNVPAGTRARVIAAPQAGAGSGTSQVVTLEGPMGQPKRGTAGLTLPRRGVGNIHAVLESAVFPETSGSADEKQ